MLLKRIPLKYITYGIFILIFIITIYFWKDLERRQQFIQIFQRLIWSQWLVLMLLQIVTFLIIVIQWKMIFRYCSLYISWKRILEIHSIGVVIESFTPVAKTGGDVTKWALLRKEISKNQTTKLTLAFLFQKIITLGVLAVFVIFFLINSVLFRDIVEHSYKLLLFMGLCFYLFYRFLNRFLKQKHRTKIKAFKQSFMERFHFSRWFFVQIFISLIIWLLYPLKGMLLASYLSLHIATPTLIVLLFASYFIAQLPLTPGGVGTFEGTLMSLLVMYTIPLEEALVYTMIFRFTTHWFNALHSLPFFLVYIWKKKQNRSSISI